MYETACIVPIATTNYIAQVYFHMSLFSLRFFSCCLLFFSAGLMSVPAAEIHPSLFFTKDEMSGIREKAHEDPYLGRLSKEMITRADEFLSTPIDPYPLSSKYNGMGTAGRAFTGRVGTLAFAGWLTGDSKYFDKAKAILLAVTRQTDPGNKEQWQTHLQYSDASQGYVIGYDWLYPYMTDDERKEVRDKIRKSGELLYSGHVVWGLPDPALLSCNHNAVQFGALGLCALVLGDEPQWLDQATHQVRAYLKYFIDDTGYAMEGLGYMGYGLSGALPFSYALQRQTGVDLVGEQPIFKLSGDNLLWKLMPNGHILAMNDNNDEPPSALHSYVAYRYGLPQVLWALQSASQKDCGTGIIQVLQGPLGAPFMLIWAKTNLQPVPPGNDWPLGHRFASGRVFLRSSWNNPQSAYVSFTSGVDAHRGHNHRDENAVTFFANGEDFLTDPGYAPNTTQCHNTMMIGGAMQMLGSQGRVVDYREDRNDAHGAFVRGQAASAYDWNTALVGYYDRKIYFIRGPHPYMIWRDDTQLEDESVAEAVEFFVTAPKNNMEVVSGGISITGANHGTHCLIKILNPGDAVTKVTPEKENRFVRHGKEIDGAKFYQQATATAKALNPHYVVLVFPYKDEAEIPQIAFHDEGETFMGRRFSCLLKFADGSQDRFSIEDENIQMTRTK
jgi:hypothetical protein